MLQVVSVLSIYTICLQIVFVSAIFLDSSCCCYEREQMTVVEASDWLTNQARVTQYKTNACSISLFIFLYLPIRDKLSWTRCTAIHAHSYTYGEFYGDPLTSQACLSLGEEAGVAGSHATNKHQVKLCPISSP